MTATQQPTEQPAAPARRPAPPNLTPWVPGQSGNPSGRPKGIVAACKRRFGEGDDLIQALHEIALDRGAKNADRIAAARELLDRRYGRAPAFALMAQADGSSPGMAQLDAAIAGMLGELRGNGAPAHPDVDATPTPEP